MTFSVFQNEQGLIDQMTNLLDSLGQMIESSQSTAEKIDALNDLSWELRDTDSNRSNQLALEAQQLSTMGEYATEPYKKGVADSLKNQTFYCMRTSQYVQGLVLGQQAKEAYDQIGDKFGQGAALSLMGGLNSNIGNFPEALQQTLRAIELLEETGSLMGVAYTLNTLANIYGSIGDDEKKLKTYLRTQEIFYRIEDTHGLALVHSNLASLYYSNGAIKNALANVKISLDLAQQEGLDYLHASSLLIIGKIKFSQENYSEAIESFDQSLKISNKISEKSTTANNHFYFAKCYLQLNQLDDSLSCLQESLSIAEEISDIGLLVDINKLFSELYKSKGDFESALKYFEKHHQADIDFHDEKSRTQVEKIKFQHEFEKITKESEALRSNQEKLQDLANLDDITGIFNRRHIFELGTEALSKALTLHQPFITILLDLDHFKSVNDKYGHLVGDQLLRLIAKHIQKNLRDNDLLGRYGGEEFIVFLPNTDLDRGVEIAARLVTSLMEEEFQIDDLEIKAAMSLGISCTNGYQQIEIQALVEQADQALYQAKKGGRNQYVVFGS